MPSFAEGRPFRRAIAEVAAPDPVCDREAMDFMQIVWILLLLAALQPVVRQKLLEATRHRMIDSLEKERRSRVITLIHRQETMRFLGIPLFRFIDINDSEQVIRAIRLTDDDVPIDLVLHTPGGLVLASFQIARALAEHPAKVTVFVPFYAMSGGTLIALAADEIVMCKHSVLGPVDPQIQQLPAASIVRAVAKKSVDRIDDETLILADQAEMALRQVHDGIVELLEGRYEPEAAESIARELSEGRYTHDYALDLGRAKAIGLHVVREMPKDFFDLMQLFPQTAQQQSAVEYLPGRRFRRPTPDTPPSDKP